MLLYINRYLYRSPTLLTSDYFVRSNEIVRTQMKNDILMKYILILQIPPFALALKSLLMMLSEKEVKEDSKRFEEKFCHLIPFPT